MAQDLELVWQGIDASIRHAHGSAVQVLAECSAKCAAAEAQLPRLQEFVQSMRATLDPWDGIDGKPGVPCPENAVPSSGAGTHCGLLESMCDVFVNAASASRSQPLASLPQGAANVFVFVCLCLRTRAATACRFACLCPEAQLLAQSALRCSRSAGRRRRQI